MLTTGPSSERARFFRRSAFSRFVSVSSVFSPHCVLNRCFSLDLNFQLSTVNLPPAPPTHLPLPIGVLESVWKRHDS